jgi:hypothetical protein
VYSKSQGTIHLLLIYSFAGAPNGVILFHDQPDGFQDILFCLLLPVLGGPTGFFFVFVLTEGLPTFFFFNTIFFQEQETG